MTPSSEGMTGTEEAAPAAPAARLAPGIPLTADQAAGVVADMLDLSEFLAGVGPGRALIAQGAYLWMLSAFLRQAREAKSAVWDEAPEAHAVELAAFRDMMSTGGPTRIRWGRIRSAAEKKVSAPMLRRMTLAIPLAAHRAARREGRISMLRFWPAWGRNVVGGRVRELAGFGAPRRWAELDAAAMSADARELMESAAAEAIRSGALAGGDSIRNAHGLLMTRFALGRLFGASRALDAGTARIAEEDYRAGLEAADARFGPGSPFREALARVPRIGGLFEGVIRQTRFPYALIHWTPEDAGRS